MKAVDDLDGRVGLEVDEEVALARLRSCLSKFEGNRSFHNFHRMSAKALKGSRRGPFVAPGQALKSALPLQFDRNFLDSDGTKEVAAPIPNEEEVEEEMEEVPRVAVDYSRVSMYEAWQASSRPIVGRSRGTVYLCRALMELREGLPVVRVRIRGQAFLLQ